MNCHGSVWQGGCFPPYSNCTVAWLNAMCSWVLMRVAVLQAELKEKLATMYDVRDPNTIFVFGFRTQVCSAGAGMHFVAWSAGSWDCSWSVHLW